MQTQFNILNIYNTIKESKKQIFIFVIVSMVVATVAVFLVPKYYKSTAVIIPANPNLADKNRLFGNNIQHLYPFFGNDNDQEIIYGFTQLDEVYDSLVHQFNLVAYYKTNGKSKEEKLRRAAIVLKEDINIIKTENNQLIITCWMKDAQLAASLCNTLVQQVNASIKAKWKNVYETEVEELQRQSNFIQQQKDSILSFLRNAEITKEGAEKYTTQLEAYNNQWSALEKKKQELLLALNTTPNALYVVQAATPAPYAEKPNKILVLITTLIASFVFAIFATALFRKKG